MKGAVRRELDEEYWWKIVNCLQKIAESRRAAAGRAQSLARKPPIVQLGLRDKLMNAPGRFGQVRAVHAIIPI